MSENHAWTLQAALPPILSTLLAFAYAIYLLAYPPKHKKASILLLALPVTYAFTHHLDVAPNWNLCDTFGRFLYIWYAHMSYEVVILEFRPTAAKETLGWKSRVKQAYKVLFDRNHTQVLKETAGVRPAAEAVAKQHCYSRRKFVAYHTAKASALYLFLSAWEVYQSHFSTTPTPTPTNTTHSPSFPSRLHTTFDWLIISLSLYELYHSLFAILFVATHIDPPSSWSLSLCNSLLEAYTVRRYWGKHWHNYIYHSFSAHVKIVTREWLGFKRGKVATRLAENALVFGASGGMHSAVRWVQEGYGEGEVWCIAVWYGAQMGPIVLEDGVGRVWEGVKRRVGISGMDWRVAWSEKGVGYVWVVGWFMWSVPKYIHTRDAWAEERIKRKQVATWEDVGRWGSEE
ncbi:Nn.00g073510.m01.CDS01 [Neocucurbitaria sp. VM-36]